MKSFTIGKRIRIMPMRYDLEGEMVRKEQFRLINDNNEKVTIETN